MLADRGARITMICATNGDVGEISDPSLATPETLGQVRREEMRRAMDVTGIADVRFLGYRDSGMQGTEDNEHPDSLLQAEPSRVVSQVVEVIRETRPDVVLTHDPTGGYGHPDHVTIQRHVTEALFPGRRPRLRTRRRCRRSPLAARAALLGVLPPQQLSPDVATDDRRGHHPALRQPGSRDHRHAGRTGHHRRRRLSLRGREDRVAELPPHPDRPQRPVFPVARSTCCGSP